MEKKSDDPDSDKETGDSTALIPVLDSFRLLHPQLKFNTFLGDSAFDSYDNYDLLLNALGFDRAVIPINRRNSKPNVSSGFNEVGCPVCPRDGTPLFLPASAGGNTDHDASNMSVPNQLRKALQGSAPARTLAPIPLTAAASMSILTKTSACTPALSGALPNGMTFINAAPQLSGILRF